MFQVREKQHTPTPHEQAILDSQPDPDEPMLLCVEAWQTLHSSRYPAIYTVAAGDRVGHFTVFGPIPHEAITDWLRWNDLDRELGAVLISVIQKLDSDRTKKILSEMK